MLRKTADIPLKDVKVITPEEAQKFVAAKEVLAKIAEASGPAKQ